MEAIYEPPSPRLQPSLSSTITTIRKNAHGDKNSGRGVTWLTGFRHKKICDACINNLRL
jgi:hypothetical protein